LAKILDIPYSAIPSLIPFHESNAKSRLLVGPFRSGKSAAAVMELYLYAMALKNCRTVCVRKTYRMLKDTVIKTFFEWVPKEAGKYSEADMIFSMPTPLGGTWEVLFRSADTAEDIEKFRGLELTNYWVDEAQEVAQDVKLILDGRLSWPAGSDRSIFKSVLTTNPCDTEHWLYKMFVMDPLPDHVYWRQSARENPHLHDSYYDELASAYRDRPELKRRYVDGEWGAIFSGKPVYGQEFAWDFHVAKEHIVPVQGLTIHRGWDFGLTPACIITQSHPNGTWNILRELWSDDMGIDEFGDAVVDFCNREFQGFLYEDVGDPAGRSRAQTDEKSCMDILATKGIWCREALTNAIIPRLESVKRRLTKSYKGRPRLLIDPRCKRLIDGFSGGYRFSERGNTGTFGDSPEKNQYSHIHDALMYIAMDLFGYSEQNTKLFSEPLKCRGVVGV